jgi:hypothetical protein
MNYWSDPQYVAFFLLNQTASLPISLVELVIGVWALRELTNRPQPARWMLAMVAVLLFAQFGIQGIQNFILSLLTWTGLPIGGASGLGIRWMLYALSLCCTAAMWWCALQAVFERDERDADAALATYPNSESRADVTT